MNEDDVIQEIINSIVANNNNEITADILRPVLVLMVEQANNIVGKLQNLNTSTKSNTVAAINEVLSLVSNAGGITVLSGTADPNVTPPSGVQLGDFYNRTSGSQTIGFYIYTGNDFFLLEDTGGGGDSTLPNEITTSSGMYLLFSARSNVAIYTGNFPGAQVIFPDPFSNQWRELTVVNQSPGVMSTGATSYIDFDGGQSTLIHATRSLKFKSDGTNWIRIN